MKNALLLLLILLLPATASAYVVYDITCDNVASIQIERLRDTEGNITSLGWYHTVRFELQPAAAAAFVRLRDATPMVPIMFRDKIYPRENLHIISHRRPLPVRATGLTEHGDHGITITVVREREAFALAEEVCPALVPAKVLANGRWLPPDPANPPVPEAPLTPTGDLAFDISCETVTKVVIVRTEDNFLGLHTPHGHVYFVSFRLKPDAGDRFQPILDESRKRTPQSGAPGGYVSRKLIITANSQPLRNDVPQIVSHSGVSVNTYLLRKEDALATARSVCPTAPVELIIPPNAPEAMQRRENPAGAGSQH